MLNIDDVSLKQVWQLYKQKNPKVRIRDAAKLLNVSEAELVATGIGDTAVALRPDWSTLIPLLESLGSVMALTRNAHVVHERHGVYKKGKVMKGHMAMGLFVNPDIDLRIFFKHWHFIFAVTEQTRAGARRSLQVFDKDGEAVHKIYLTQASNQRAYDALVETLRHDEQTPALEIAPVAARRFNTPDADIDVAGFHEAWDTLKDTHDFFPLLREYRLDRLQALQLAETSRAQPVTNDSLRVMLQKAAAQQLEIMVFVGSRGVIQIHTGTVTKLAEVGEWYNVLDPEFNLHIRETAIASSWVVAKPSVDGQVTSLECYDADGELIIQCFGKRKPGIAENPAWRTLVTSLPKEVCSDVA